jgi:hypothetical protein
MASKKKRRPGAAFFIGQARKAPGLRGNYWPAAVEAAAGAAVEAAAGVASVAGAAVEAAAGASAAGAAAGAAVEAAAGAVSAGAALSSLLLQPERAATAMRARAAIGANFMVWLLKMFL